MTAPAPETKPELDRHGPRPLGFGDGVLALFVFAGLLAAYVFTLQTRLNGDGCLLGSYAYLRGAELDPAIGGEYPHVLYLPLATAAHRGLAWAAERVDWIPTGDPLLSSKLLSSLCAALGAACTYFIARAFGSWRIGALLAALLVGLSPAAWSFATTVEVHAMHFAFTALAACVALFAPWRIPPLAMLLAALVFPLVYLSHQAGALLGLGWVLLVQLARSRKARPLPAAELWLGVAPLLLVVLIATMASVQLGLHGRFVPQVGDHREYVEVFHSAPGELRRVFLQGWLLPLFVLVPLGIAGLLRRSRTPYDRATVAAFVLPQIAFFFWWVWWAVGERGGYFLDTAPFLAALGASALPLHRASRTVAVCVLVALVSIQAGAGRIALRVQDQGFDPAGRVAAVRDTLGDSGLFVVAQPTGPRIDIWLPDVREAHIGALIAEALGAGRSPEAFVEETALPLLDVALGLGPVVFDQSHRALARPEIDLRAPYLDRFQQAVEERYVTRLVPDRWWPVLVIERRR